MLGNEVHNDFDGQVDDELDDELDAGFNDELDGFIWRRVSRRRLTTNLTS